MGNVGITELLILLALVLLFFGAKKIPELAQGLGKGIREFRKEVRDTRPDGEKTVTKVDTKS